MLANLKPIGTIESHEGMFYIQLNEEVFEATLGLSDYSHLQVVWWCHLIEDKDRALKVIDKPYKKGPDKIGLLATRSPVRPNPIAITPCQLLSIDEKTMRLYIPYIDAEPGTPVLDIKPYLPSVDRVEGATYPNWCKHWPSSYEESGEFDWGAEFNF